MNTIAKNRSLMKPVRLYAFPLLALVGSACGSAPPAVQAPPAPKPAVEEEKPKGTPPALAEQEVLPFLASATAPTEDLAYAQASRRLAVALFNDDSLLQVDAFSDQIAETVHLKSENAYETTTGSDGVTVKIGLSEEEISAVFSRVEEALMDVQLEHLPAVVAGPIRGLRLARLFEHLCVRQKEVLPESNCEGSDVKEAERELLHLSAQVKLLPTFADGIPCSKDAFLRPLSFRVVETEDNNALAGLPVLLTTTDSEESVSLLSDEEGEVSYVLPEQLSLKSTIEVQVDTEKLLGPLQDVWKSEALSIQARPVGIARSAVVFREGDTVSGKVSERVSSTLKREITEPVKLSRDQKRKLSRASKRGLKTLAPSFADQEDGRLDTILIVSGESEFASRMGTHRVWYEARGKIVAVNAWTGVVMTEVEAVVTESGVGEARAERASQEALGRELALKLKTALKDS